MSPETISDYYLAEAENYRNAYKHLNIVITPDEAKSRVVNLGYKESQFREKLLGPEVPHALKALCCIALGTESQTMLHEHNPNNPKVDVVLQTGNETDGWNIANIMYLMRELY